MTKTRPLLSKLAVADNENRIVFLLNSELETLDKIDTGHEEELMSLAWVGNFFIVVGFKDGLIKGFNAETGCEELLVNPFQKQMASFAVFDMTQVLVGDVAGRIFSLDISEKRVKWVLPNIHKTGYLIPTLCLNDNQTLLASGSRDRSVAVLEMQRNSKATLKWKKEIDSVVISCKWVPGGTYLLVLGRHSIYAMYPSSGVILAELKSQNQSNLTMSLMTTQQEVILGNMTNNIQILKLVSKC